MKYDITLIAKVNGAPGLVGRCFRIPVRISGVRVSKYLGDSKELQKELMKLTNLYYKRRDESVVALPIFENNHVCAHGNVKEYGMRYGMVEVMELIDEEGKTLGRYPIS